MKAVRALFGEFRTGQGLKGQLLRGGFWSLVIKLMSTLMALVLAVVLARLLGAEGFGIYSFVLALVTILAIPAQMGLPNLVVRETAKAQAAQRFDLMKGLWRWSSLVALMMSAGLIALGALAAWLFAENLGPAQAQTLWWGLLLVPLVALGNLRGAALRGLRKVVQGQLPEFVLRPLFLILMALLAVFVLGQTLGPAEAMMLHVAAALAAFMIGGWLLLRERPAELAAQATTTTEGKPWLASALPLALMQGVTHINQNSGILVLGVLGTPTDVGFLKVAVQSAALVAFGISAVEIVIAPHLARQYAQGNHAAVKSLVTMSARFVLALAIPVSCLFYIFGAEIITIFFGSEFAPAYVLLVIYMASQIVKALVSNVAILLTMTGHESEVARGVVLGALGNVILAICLVPFWGAVGAAIASAISASSCYLLLWYRARVLLAIDTTAFQFPIRPKELIG